MKAHKKALELCQKFGYTTIFSNDNGGKTLSIETAKKCALIAVYEMKQIISGAGLKAMQAYLDEVKTEIEKL